MYTSTRLVRSFFIFGEVLPKTQGAAVSAFVRLMTLSLDGRLRFFHTAL